MRWLKHLCPILLAVVALAGCASNSRQANALESVQYAWSAAIRWGDFEGAWSLVDPELRKQRPVTPLQFERYNQVRISAYRELASRGGEGEAMREIEIGVINRHTMAERSLRYTERWRYDPEAKTWWQTSGLPDFWGGE